MNRLFYNPLVVPLCSATCVMISFQGPTNAADAHRAFIVHCNYRKMTFVRMRRRGFFLYFLKTHPPKSFNAKHFMLPYIQMLSKWFTKEAMNEKDSNYLLKQNERCEQLSKMLQNVTGKDAITSRAMTAIVFT